MERANIDPRPDLVIYHGPACYDGHTAAWLLWREFPEACFIPANYGETDPSDVAYKNVVVVDFSWKRDIMIEMYVQARSLLVLDHHKTAEAELEGLHFAKFDMNRSGCRMVWDWLYPDEDPPWLVKYIEDRDLWRMSLDCTREVHAYITSKMMTFTTWDDMSRMQLYEVKDYGSIVRESINRYCEKVSEMVEFYKLPGGELAVVVNAPYLNSSELADFMLRKYREAQLSVVWSRGKDNMFNYGLRSRRDYDVSEIARAYGGGGHAQAAGFELGMPPFSLPEWIMQ